MIPPADDAVYYAQFKKAPLKKVPPADWKNDSQAHHLAVIVPYRDNSVQDRSKQLSAFVPFMTRYLKQLMPERQFSIIIVEQSQDGQKFNRGKLLNAGFEIAREKGCDYHIFHDVDLLPGQSLLGYYARYPEAPMHIAAFWQKYRHLDLFFGGVCAINTGMFEKLNGYPNEFWGWGGEDEELYHRITDHELQVLIPESGDFHEMEHVESKSIPDFENDKRFEQIEQRKKDGKTDGLSTLKIKNRTAIVQLNDYTYKYTIEL